MPKLAVLNTHPIQYFAPLYRRLAIEPGIDLTVYYCSRQGAEDYFDPGFGQYLKWDTPLLEGYEHRFLKNLRTRDQVAGFWSLINFEIIRELRRNKYDALWVNGHNCATYLMGIFAARFFGIPVFMRCESHLLLRRSRLKRLIRKPLMSLFYQRLCNLCLPIGTRNREFYREHGVEEEKLFTVPYAVDNAYFMRAAERYGDSMAAKRELGLPGDIPLVLSVSKMAPGKRLMDLLIAFHRIRSSDINAALLFVGSGDQETLLQEYVRDHKLSNVYFFGFRNQSELPKFYAVSDVFAFPSESETWGLILNEVMCAGLPVIASQEIGAVPDLVHHGENGFTFEAGNIDQLTSYLLQMLKSSELRKRMGAQSLQLIKHWNYDWCARGVNSALEYVARESAQLATSLSA